MDLTHKTQITTYQSAVERYRHAPGDPDVHAALFAEIERLQGELASACMPDAPKVVLSEAEMQLTVAEKIETAQAIEVVADGLLDAFDWEDSIEGEDYWWDIECLLRKKVRTLRVCAKIESVGITHQ